MSSPAAKRLFRCAGLTTAGVERVPAPLWITVLWQLARRGARRYRRKEFLFPSAPSLTTFGSGTRSVSGALALMSWTPLTSHPQAAMNRSSSTSSLSTWTTPLS